MDSEFVGNVSKYRRKHCRAEGLEELPYKDIYIYRRKKKYNHSREREL